MAPQKNPTHTATVHSTDTDTFTKQLRAIVSANAATPHQQVLANVADQIDNLKKRMEPTRVPKSWMIGTLRYHGQAEGTNRRGKDPNSKRVLAKERKKGNLSLKLKMLEAT